MSAAVERDGSRVDAAARPVAARGLLALACVGALWAVLHPYLGITWDAGLYIGRALADLDPDGVGRDLMFVHDGQSQFSVFRLLARLLVARLGTDAAARTIATAGSVVWVLALMALAVRLARGRTVWLVVVFVAALPMAYGAPRHFAFGEVNALPRPFAEAAVLAALSAFLVGHRLRTLALLALAFVFHPLMALAGVAVVFVMLAFEDRRWLAVGPAAAVLALGLGAAGVPMFDRLVTVVDPDWKQMLTDRSPHLFPTLWPSETFGLIAVQAATLVIGARLIDGARRRLLLATAIVGLGGVAAAVALCDWLSLVMFVQVQPWRATWLMSVMAGASLALCTVGLWQRGSLGRLTLAVLAFGWFFDTAAVVALPVAAIALALQFRGAALAPRLAMRHVAFVWGLVAAAVIFWRAGTLIGYAQFLAGLPPGDPASITDILRNGIHTLPICAVAAVWTLGRWRLPAAAMAGLACGLAAVAALTWDARTPTQKLIDAGRHPAALEALVATRPGEVLWLDGLTEAWYLLGRPQWQSAQQGVSIVFSRPLAFELRARTRDLMDLGLAKPNSLTPWKPVHDPQPLHVSRQAVATLCVRPDAPSWIIAPLIAGEPPPEVPFARWPLPAPLFVFRGDDEAYVWDRVDAYAVIACAAPSGSGAAVQMTDAR